MKSDIFTPNIISKKMSSFFEGRTGSLLEPSVGEGNLLEFLNLDKFSSITCCDINSEYLDKCKVSYNDDKINYIKGNFLMENLEKFDNIIMNPPYISSKNISREDREFIKSKWDILKHGNIDIFYAFILKCIDLLNINGLLVALIPNNILYNKSAIHIRKYLFDNKYIEEIIDFETNKIFKNISTHSCIMIISKKEKDKFIYNSRVISYDDKFKNYNIFLEENISEEKTLGDICVIKGGFATLRNKIYIHEERKFNESCWREALVSGKKKWVIYPYDYRGKILCEDCLKTDNPLTYEYFLKNKEELSKRDNGKKNYTAWYAYGREHNLTLSKSEKVIYISTFINPDNFPYIINEPILYSGCISIDIKEGMDYNIDDIMKILNKRENKEFIKNNCSKRNNGWINLSPRIIKELEIIL